MFVSGEFDPTNDLGLFPDKSFVASCHGFLLRNDPVKDLCERYIDKGRNFLKVLRRYDDLTAYILGREEAVAGNSVKWAVPFLKAFGATDNGIYTWCRDHMDLVPGSCQAMRYITNLMPSALLASEYEHAIMPLNDALEAPDCNIECTALSMDSATFGRSDSRRLRELAAEISSLKVPSVKYEIDVPMEVDEADVRIITTLDNIFQEEIPGISCAMSLMESIDPLNSFKKGYSLVNLRKETNIDFDSTVFVGSDHTDFQSLDLVRDQNGLAIAFNGEEFAVRGCNVCVNSNDSTVVAVLTQEFFNGGIQSVTDLVNNWNRQYLKKADMPDRHLMDCMLKAHPRKLPEVHMVDKHNVEEISKTSETYRSKIMPK